MAKVTLRNEDTPEGKEIWEAVDTAASRAPEWVKGTVAKILAENIARSSKSGEGTVARKDIKASKGK